MQNIGQTAQIVIGGLADLRHRARRSTRRG
jgi:hypothetical protein